MSKMKSTMKELEMQQLINEMVFLKEDLKLKEEISKEIEKDFNTHLEDIVNSDEGLKEQWQSSIVNNKPFDIDIDIDINNDKTIKGKIHVSDGMKKIYRDIAKLTHPDKTDDNEKNDTYMKATESYENDDIIDLIYYAKKLGIVYDYNTLDITKMKENILDIKAKINTYQNSISFKWYYNDKSETVIKNYIATQFITNM